MKIVNRGFISILPTPLFIQWAKNNSDETQFFTQIPEPSIYLIEEDFWDNGIIEEKYFKKIMKTEFSILCSSVEKFPKIESLDDFKSFFIISLGTIVHDLLKEKLEAK
jgi:hypothetical protein